MDVLDAVLVGLAGLAAGAINTVVGSGTLVTFPALLAAGYSPLTANVSNGIGLVPGSVAGAIGYRRELRGQRRRVIVLAAGSLLGGVLGAVALLTLPEEAFEAIVPFFVLLALAAIAAGPWLSRWVEARRARRNASGEPGGEPDGAQAGARGRTIPVSAWIGVLVAGVYGGYFGAAQGILLLAILGAALADDLQRLNALKNVLAGLVNAVSGVLFIVIADPAWAAVALIAATSAVGGVLGARYGRRLSPKALRGVILAVGAVAFVLLVT